MSQRPSSRSRIATAPAVHVGDAQRMTNRPRPARQVAEPPQECAGESPGGLASTSADKLVKGRSDGSNRGAASGVVAHDQRTAERGLPPAPRPLGRSACRPGSPKVRARRCRKVDEGIKSSIGDGTQVESRSAEAPKLAPAGVGRRQSVDCHHRLVERNHLSSRQTTRPSMRAPPPAIASHRTPLA